MVRNRNIMEPVKRRNRIFNVPEFNNRNIRWGYGNRSRLARRFTYRWGINRESRKPLDK